MSKFLEILKKTAVEWQNDNALRLSAAISYYTIFSLGPLILLLTGVLGMFFEHQAITGELSAEFRNLMGDSGAKALELFASSSKRSSAGILATVVGTLTLILGASSVFAELESSLNLIWKAEPVETSGLVQYMKTRLLTFAMVLVIGLILLLSVVMNFILTASSSFISKYLLIPPVVSQALYFCMTLVLTTVLFAAIFKFLPAPLIRWKDVRLGAFFTAVLFSVGKFLIGLYIGSLKITDYFGASASVVLVLAWTYYSAMIFLFGAEFTKVVAESRKTETGKSAPFQIPSTQVDKNSTN